MQPDSWFFKFGDVGLHLYAFAGDRKPEIDDLQRAYAQVTTQPIRDEFSIVMVEPGPLDGPIASPDLTPSICSLWEKLHRLWEVLEPDFLGGNFDTATLSSIPWVPPWDEVVPGSIILRYNRQSHPFFFCFLLRRQQHFLFSLVPFHLYYLAALWYLQRGGLLVHGAAVAHRSGGMLFLGPGSAGKSTVCMMAKERAVPVLSDDQVLIIPHQAAGFSLHALPGRFGKIFTTHPEERPPLRAIFSLVKAQEDQVVPLSQQQTADLLWKAFSFETGWPRIEATKPFGTRAQDIAATIARTVPGYELHFRKSPDFWDVIDAEFGR